MDKRYEQIAISVVLIFLVGSVGYLLIDSADGNQQSAELPAENETDIDNSNQTQSENEPENPLDETETSGEVVDYESNKTQTQTGYNLSLETPPKRGGSTDIYFQIDGEGVEGAEVLVDGEYQRDTQTGLAAGRAFIPVPDKDEFTVSIKHEGETYEETFDTVG
jgi:hypothetical protein